jgi:hypothetical protein
VADGFGGGGGAACVFGLGFRRTNKGFGTGFLFLTRGGPAFVAMVGEKRVEGQRLRD